MGYRRRPPRRRSVRVQPCVPRPDGAIQSVRPLFATEQLRFSRPQLIGKRGGTRSSFLQISAMTLGGLIHGDRRLIEHEKAVRMANRARRDAAVWRAYEESFEAEGRRREILSGRKGGADDEPGSEGGKENRR